MLFPLPQRCASDERRVVVTGAGIVTALGFGWAANAEGFRVGRCAFRPVSLFDVSRHRVKVAAEIDLQDAPPLPAMPQRLRRRLDRAGHLLVQATAEAMQQASWDPATFPLVLGTTGAGMTLGEAYYLQASREPKQRGHQASRAIGYQGQTHARLLAETFGFDGPTHVIANACATGTNAIGHAWELIRDGLADRVLTGGYDTLSQLVFSGFDSLQALSPTICRPFDAARDGLAMGEGAAVLAMETLEHARRRGAGILGEVIGYGAANDTHHLTQPEERGKAALASMRAACGSARITPADVDYINAHGTGTPLNDKAEAAAIVEWGGARARTLPVSSVKGSVGHSLGAAGAVEAVVSLMALREQWLPPEPTLQTPDPACLFPVVREPVNATVNVVLSNSFGFGGSNATLVLRRFA